MPGIEEEELESEELDGGSPETQEKPQSEPERELHQDPNEPIQVETDEAKVSRRRQARAERQNKFRQMEEESSRLRREVEELRQRAQYQAPPQQYQQQQQENPVQTRLRSIDEANKSLHREYTALHQAGKMTPQMEEEFQTKAINLRRAEIAAITQAAQPQVNQQEIISKAIWAQFTTKHADIFHDPNPNVQKWAWAKYHEAMADGKADTEELVEEILDQTRIKFGKTPRKLRGSRPDENTRQRFTGVSSRGGGGSGVDDGIVEMSAHDKRMARIAFGDRKDPKTGKPWTEQQQYQYWANTVGKKRAALGKKTG